MNEELNSEIVRIWPEGEVTPEAIPVGTGILVGENQILTCAHVIADALGIDPSQPEKPEQQVQIDFPFVAAREIYQAKIQVWQPIGAKEGEDIAGLIVEAPLPDGVRPATLSNAKYESGALLQAFGFPEGYSETGARADLKWVGLLTNGWIQVRGDQTEGLTLSSGFSGGPVVNLESQAVVGITVAADLENLKYKVGAFIPTEILMKVWPQPMIERCNTSKEQEWNASKQQGERKKPSKKPSYQARFNLFQIISLSLLIAGLTIGIRSIGILQSLELLAFDQFLSLRLLLSPEKPDPRLLIVEIDQNDIDNLGGFPLRDKVISESLKVLEQYHPRLIVLDIYRDVPHGSPSEYDELVKFIKEKDDIIATCQYSDKDSQGSQEPDQFPIYRLGFSNLLPDKDSINRRYLLAKEANLEYTCQTTGSLAFVTAFYYLNKQGFVQDITDEGNIFFRKEKADQDITPIIPLPLGDPVSGYQQRDATQGNQILINYRANIKPAETVTLTELLDNEVLAALVTDKVVMIGNTYHRDNNDMHNTPYNRTLWQKRMPGVLIHTHVVSQILSTVLDGRPSFRILPQRLEDFWIWCWSLGAALIAGLSGSSKKILISSTLFLILQFLTCYSLLALGIWVSVIPIALSGLSIFFVGLILQNKGYSHKT